MAQVYARWHATSEFGFTRCELLRFVVDVVGIVGGALLASKTFVEAQQSGSLWNWRPTRSKLDIDWQRDHGEPPPATAIGRIGESPTQNADLQIWLRTLDELGAKDIRVNQEQVTFDYVRVGRNRPDLQFTLNNRRYYVEWDTPTSGRGLGHATRILANDPAASKVLALEAGYPFPDLAGLAEQVILILMP